MDALDVAAALASALLHASWNAAVKASRDPPRAMTAQMLLSAVLVLPGLLWSGLPPLAAWPWIAASTLLNVVTVTALLRGYELGGFGLVYPVARAIAVVLVVPLVAVVAGGLPGAAALGGIAIIALSLAVLAWDTVRDRGVPLQALAWIFCRPWRGSSSQASVPRATSCATHKVCAHRARHGPTVSSSRSPMPRRCAGASATTGHRGGS